MSGFKFFTYVQSTPSTTWNIVHNLGSKVVSDVVLANGTKLLPLDVIHVSDNEVQILFTAPVAGTVRLLAVSAWMNTGPAITYPPVYSPSGPVTSISGWIEEMTANWYGFKPAAFALSPTNELYVAGRGYEYFTNGTTGFLHYYATVLKFDSTGAFVSALRVEPLTESTYHVSDVFSINFTEDGNLMVSGKLIEVQESLTNPGTYYFGNNVHYFSKVDLLYFDSAIWTRKVNDAYDPQTGYTYGINEVVANTDALGNTYGLSLSLTGQGTFVSKTDSAGNELWKYRFMGVFPTTRGDIIAFDDSNNAYIPSSTGMNTELFIFSGTGATTTNVSFNYSFTPFSIKKLPSGNMAMVASMNWTTSAAIIKFTTGLSVLAGHEINTTLPGFTYFEPAGMTVLSNNDVAILFSFTSPTRNGIAVVRIGSSNNVVSAAVIDVDASLYNLSGKGIEKIGTNTTDEYYIIADVNNGPSDDTFSKGVIAKLVMNAGTATVTMTNAEGIVYQAKEAAASFSTTPMVDLSLGSPWVMTPDEGPFGSRVYAVGNVNTILDNPVETKVTF